MRIEQRALPDVLPDLGDLPPLLTRRYASRGVQSVAELAKSRGFPAIALQTGYEGDVLALCLFQPQQLRDLLHQARGILRDR